MNVTTKDRIFQSFLELLSEKPFDKITVRDIVERCNINRNTFYYYYSDIYELLEELFKREFSEMVSKYNSGFRWLVGFSRMIENCYGNKKIINNICASKSYEYLETYLFKTCKEIMADYVYEIAKDKNIKRNSLEFIISYHQYGVIGTLSEWFRTGMSETPQEILREFLIVFEGMNAAIDRADQGAK